VQNPSRYFNSSPEVIFLTVMIYIRFRCGWPSGVNLGPEFPNFRLL
jgi:hypothetical protein